MRIIGDVHGKIDSYIKICRDAETTIQLGDLSLSPIHYKYIEENLNPDSHKFIPGNHDNYNSLPLNSLGDYGPVQLDGITFFFIRGAFSIDYKCRRTGIDWFIEEELSLKQLNVVLKLYKEFKPDIVFSHDAPREISEIIGNPSILSAFGYNPETFTTNTSDYLQHMFECHQPKIWKFGHFHISKTLKVNGTEFQCLNELEWVDI